MSAKMQTHQPAGEKARKRQKKDALAAAANPSAPTPPCISVVRALPHFGGTSLSATAKSPQPSPQSTPASRESSGVDHPQHSAGPSSQDQLPESHARGTWPTEQLVLMGAAGPSLQSGGKTMQEHRKPAVTEPGEMLPELISCPLGVPPQPATLLPASEDPPRPQTQPPASFLLLRVGDGASDVPCNIVAEQQEMEGDGNNLPSHSTHASQAQTAAKRARKYEQKVLKIAQAAAAAAAAAACHSDPASVAETVLTSIPEIEGALPVGSSKPLSTAVQLLPPTPPSTCAVCDEPTRNTNSHPPHESFHTQSGVSHDMASRPIEQLLETGGDGLSDEIWGIAPQSVPRTKEIAAIADAPTAATCQSQPTAINAPATKMVQMLPPPACDASPCIPTQPPNPSPASEYLHCIHTQPPTSALQIGDASCGALCMHMCRSRPEEQQAMEGGRTSVPDDGVPMSCQQVVRQACQTALAKKQKNQSEKDTSCTADAEALHPQPTLVAGPVPATMSESAPPSPPAHSRLILSAAAQPMPPSPEPSQATQEPCDDSRPQPPASATDTQPQANHLMGNVATEQQAALDTAGPSLPCDVGHKASQEAEGEQDRNAAIKMVEALSTPVVDASLHISSAPSNLSQASDEAPSAYTQQPAHAEGKAADDAQCRFKTGGKAADDTQCSMEAGQQEKIEDQEDFLCGHATVADFVAAAEEALEEIERDAGRQAHAQELVERQAARKQPGKKGTRGGSTAGKQTLLHSVSAVESASGGAANQAAAKKTAKRKRLTRCPAANNTSGTTISGSEDLSAGNTASLSTLLKVKAPRKNAKTEYPASSPYKPSITDALSYHTALAAHSNTLSFYGRCDVLAERHQRMSLSPAWLQHPISVKGMRTGSTARQPNLRGIRMEHSTSQQHACSTTWSHQTMGPSNPLWSFLNIDAPDDDLIMTPENAAAWAETVRAHGGDAMSIRTDLGAGV